MSNQLSTIQELRNRVCGNSVERGDDTKRIRMKKPSVSKKAKSRKVAVEDSPRGRRSGRSLNKREFKVWLGDVNEAVDQFIGMNMDVLPKMPWKKWYAEGLSAVVAAKNAVQMYEDLEDDEGDDSEEWDDEDENEDTPEDQDLEELFGMGQMPYHKWYKKLAAMMKKGGVPLDKVQKKFNLTNADIHTWYNAGYKPKDAIKKLLQTGQPSRVAIESKGDGLSESLKGWATTLGLKQMGLSNKSLSFMKKQDSENEVVDAEEFAEENGSVDNRAVVETKSDALFGIDINDLAQQARSVVNAKPRKIERKSDPIRVREDPYELIENDGMLGVNTGVGEVKGEANEEQEVDDGETI